MKTLIATVFLGLSMNLFAAEVCIITAYDNMATKVHKNTTMACGSNITALNNGTVAIELSSKLSEGYLLNSTNTTEDMIIYTLIKP